jgi:hypothetical protein
VLLLDECRASFSRVEKERDEARGAHHDAETRFLRYREEIDALDEDKRRLGEALELATRAYQETSREQKRDCDAAYIAGQENAEARWREEYDKLRREFDRCVADRDESRDARDRYAKAHDAALADLSQARAELDEAKTQTRIAWKTLAEVNKNHEAEVERLGIDHADTLVLINAQREKFERDADAAIARAEAAEAQAKGANTYAGQLADDAGRYMRELEAERAAHAATKAKLGRAVAALREARTWLGYVDAPALRDTIDAILAEVSE